MADVVEHICEIVQSALVQADMLGKKLTQEAHT